MAYFITGATGFIGKFLVEKLLTRKGDLYLLVREGSIHKLDELKERFPQQWKRIKPLNGDISLENLGLSEEQLTELKDAKIQHVFHLAAHYDLTASFEEQEQANVQGTKHVVELANEIQAGCFNLASSIAVAGMYPGIFREDMFEEAESLEHPYFKTKHQAEAIARNRCKVPLKIYRPGMVIGHSKTGYINKVDGPYYFFKMIQKFRSALPPWAPTIGIEGGQMNLVPVDYVVDAMDHIAHKQEVSGGCFHLTDPNAMRLGEVLNVFASAGHAPKMALRLDSKLFNFIPSYMRTMLMALPPVQRIKQVIFEDMGIPENLVELMDYPTRFDNRETKKALADSEIELPDLAAYAAPIWDYWERNLDPDLFTAQNLKQAVEGKVVMLTGGTSGIGLATAQRLAQTDCTLILVARKEGKLERTKAELEQIGTAKIVTYSCDLANTDKCEELVKNVLRDHNQVDVLINNAGRSIRRSVEHSLDRFHDFERTMQINYFSCLKLIMGLLPSMSERQTGHIINISSIGVLTNAPRFSAYVASKSALEAFTRCAAAEYSDTGIRFTTINMPLVDTPMIAPTKIYQLFPTLKPEQAADMVVEGIVRKPKRIATRLGIVIQVLYYLMPRVTEVIFNTTFRMFKDSPAAAGDRRQLRKSLTSEQLAVSKFMKGIHL